MMGDDLIRDIGRRSSECYWFDEYCYRAITEERIEGFTYLSSGQEWIAATVAATLNAEGIYPNVFCQHRNHAPYLSFGGDPGSLRDELLGKTTGTTQMGIGGDPCNADADAGVYGHVGLIADQVPIAVGHCFGTRHPTVVFLGDGAVEEDYFGPALSMAVKFNLPILFIVEDNDLSVLTPVKDRRTWLVKDLAEAYGLLSNHVNDNHIMWLSAICSLWIEKQTPYLLNVHCKRKYWHVCFKNSYGSSIIDNDERSIVLTTEEEQSIKQEMGSLWGYI